MPPVQPHDKPVPASSALRGALIYAGIASTWILVSDQVLAWCVGTGPLYQALQTWKGGAFVLVTAALVWLLLRRTRDRLNARQKQIKTLRDFFHESLAQQGHILYRLDVLRGGYDYLSPSVERSTGFAPSHYVHMGLDEIFAELHPEDAPRIQARFVEAQAQAPTGVQRISLELDYRIRSADGGWRHWRDHTTMIVQDRRMVAFVGAVHDVTALRQAEQQLLHHQRLQSIADLANSVAHDFNNILAIISGATEVLQRSGGDLSQARQLEHILAASQRGAELTRHLISFARPSHVSQETLELDGLVHDSVQLLRSSLPETITLRVEAEPHRILGDAQRLQQAIFCVLKNAKDALPNGGTIAVSLRKALESDKIGQDWRLPPPEGPALLLEIVDTGEGIAPDVIHRVCEPFFTTKGPGHGSGLGLSAVYGIIRDHAGSLALRSAVGRGTQVRLLLPYTSGQPGLRTPSDVHDMLHRPADCVVLVVDDEPLLRDALASLLFAAGYRVVVAADGIEALARIGQQPQPHIILSDLSMPRLDGLGLCEAVRMAHPQLPVVLMSGRVEDEQRQQLLQAGACAIIEKPARLEAIQAALDQALHRWH